MEENCEKKGILKVGLISIVFFGDSCQAYGAVGGLARSTPYLGDYIEISEELDSLGREMSDQAYNAMNYDIEYAEKKASETVVQWLEYEMKSLKCNSFNVNAVQKCIRVFYLTIKHEFRKDITISVRHGFLGLGSTVKISKNVIANINPHALKFQACLKSACEFSCECNKYN